MVVRIIVKSRRSTGHGDAGKYEDPVPLLEELGVEGWQSCVQSSQVIKRFSGVVGAKREGLEKSSEMQVLSRCQGCRDGK